MQLITQETPDLVSQHVANLIISRLKAFQPSHSRPHYILGLPTGSTSESIYALLVKAYQAGEISFKNVVTFNMDEYVGLPASHPQSYHTFMYTHLFAHIDIPRENVHILNGMAPDLDAECARYEAAIQTHGPVDFFLGGVGPSGHIAFNEPFSSLTSRTRPVVLAASTVAANARFFGNDLTQVPTAALTVGVGTIMDAREVCIVATGRGKADAVWHAVEGAVSAGWTISRLQEHPTWTLCVDREAAAKLRRETVDYFQRVEDVESRTRGRKARL